VGEEGNLSVAPLADDESELVVQVLSGGADRLGLHESPVHHASRSKILQLFFRGTGGKSGILW
jgi:hypothetical protein